MRKICLILAIFLFFISCSDTPPDGKDYTFTVSVVENPDNLDPILAKNTAAKMLIANIFTGLFTFDKEGKLTNGVIQNYEKIGLTYTFYLGENYWNGKNLEEPVLLTADDFVFALERGNFSYIEKFAALDEKTLEITLNRELDDFLYMLTLPEFMPCNRKLFENAKGRYGLDESSIPSNGSFYVTKWQYDPYGKDNIIYTKRNNANNSEADIFPAYVNFRILKSYSDTVEYYQNKEISVLLANSPLKDMDYYSKTQDKVVGLTFGENFSDSMTKKAIDYATNREISEVDPADIAYNILPPAFGENIPISPIYFDFEKAQTQKQLSSSLISKSFNILTCKEIIDTDLLYPIKENYERLFGVKIGFEIIESRADYEKRLVSENFDIAIKEITADYRGFGAVLQNFPVDNNDNFYIIPIETTTPVAETTDIPKETTEVTTATTEITEVVTETYENMYISANEFAEKQQEIIDNADFIPLFYNSTYLYAKKNVADIVFIPFNNVAIFKYARNLSE